MNLGNAIYGIYINADDTAIIANNLEELQYTLNRINEVGNSFGLCINTAKTKS